MPSLFTELRRRHVFNVGAAYAIVGWLLIEVAATMLPIFGAPDWLLRAFSFFVLLGFPVALVLSWIYDLTPEGLERTGSEDRNTVTRPSSGSKLNLAIVALLVVAAGYMFVDNYVLDAPRPPFAGAEVDPVSASAPLAEPPVAAATTQSPPPVADQQPAAPLTAIAVLPFDNLSPDPNNAYFASGIHEEILNALAKISALEVEARTSVLRFAENKPPIEEIAAELSVGSILEGSVRFADNRVRVTTQLIDASSGSHLWSETYEHEFEDIFAIESDVAMNIANAVEAEFSEEEQQDIYTPRSESPQALALLWQAGEAMQSRDTATALALLDRAIEIDPNFASAYAWRAYAGASTIGPQTANDPVALAELEASITQDVEQALSLDAEQGAAYSAVATLHGRHRRSAEAQAAFQRSYELLPNFPPILWLYSNWSSFTGQFAQGIRLAEEAVALAPADPIGLATLARSQQLAGELEQAADSMRAHLEIAPTSDSHLELATIAATLGNAVEALEHLRIVEQLQPNGPPPRQAQRILVYALIDHMDDAQSLRDALESRLAQLGGDAPETRGPRALIALAFGEDDVALEALREVAADEDRILGGGAFEHLVKNNVWNLPVLEEPEFVEVRARLGQPPI